MFWPQALVWKRLCYWWLGFPILEQSPSLSLCLLLDSVDLPSQVSPLLQNCVRCAHKPWRIYLEAEPAEVSSSSSFTLWNERDPCSSGGGGAGDAVCKRTPAHCRNSLLHNWDAHVCQSLSSYVSVLQVLMSTIWTLPLATQVSWWESQMVSGHFLEWCAL